MENKKLRHAYIYGLNEIIQKIYFDYFSSEITEQAYFFMLDGKNVAIIPYKYLIIFDNSQ
jgi:hypothetical protein